MDSIEAATLTFPGPVSATAYNIALQAHSGQHDKVGAPYITHPVRVAALLAQRGWPDEVVAAGYLHDVVEDTDWSATSLREAGIPAETVRLVVAMTRLAGQDPDEYYSGLVAAGTAAVAIKEADIDDNTDPARTSLLEPEVRERLSRKYDKARSLLTSPKAGK